MPIQNDYDQSPQPPTCDLVWLSLIYQNPAVYISLTAWLEKIVQTLDNVPELWSINYKNHMRQTHQQTPTKPSLSCLPALKSRSSWLDRTFLVNVLATPQYMTPLMVSSPQLTSWPLTLPPPVCKMPSQQYKTTLPNIRQLCHELVFWTTYVSNSCQLHDLLVDHIDNKQHCCNIMLQAIDGTNSFWFSITCLATDISCNPWLWIILTSRLCCCQVLHHQFQLVFIAQLDWAHHLCLWNYPILLILPVYISVRLISFWIFTQDDHNACLHGTP